MQLRVSQSFMQASSNAKNLQESDSALMMSFAGGDYEGFNLLYRRHSASIYRFFYFGTHADTALAEELYYDVWLTVVRGRMRYTHDINFKDWLYHSAWARLHDHLRLHSLDRDSDNLKTVSRESAVVSMAEFVAETDKARSDGLTSDVSDNSRNDETVVAEVEDDKSLVDAIVNLSAEQKEVVLLRYCLSMSNQDIADFIDVGKSTVDRISREASGLLRRKVSVTQAQRDQFNG